MSKTLIGICSFGGLKFLKIGMQALHEQSGDFDLLVIAARPGDDEMLEWLGSQRCSVIAHAENKGFAAAINDMYDRAFVEGDYDNLIIMGNDVVPMPDSVGSMIHCADTTDYEMVCGSEFNARFLYDHYPEARKFFHGEHLIFTDWGARPWLLHHDGQAGVEPDTRKDIRNFTLFKRSSFEKVGYADVNFWPNAYFEDNCYGRRCDLLGVRACGLKEAAFFHFTSRTIHQNVNRDHNAYFNRNRIYYTHKWNGEPGQEKYFVAFNNGPYFVGGTSIPCKDKISTREHEAACIAHWSRL